MLIPFRFLDKKFFAPTFPHHREPGEVWRTTEGLAFLLLFRYIRFWNLLLSDVFLLSQQRTRRRHRGGTRVIKYVMVM